MPIKHFPLLLLLLLFTSCEKEIDISYREVSPLYVAEASITQERTNVRLTTTRSVTENSSKNSLVAGATIIISEGSYMSDTLTYIGNGTYRSSFTGMPGSVYTLDIYVDGQHFSSTSTMQDLPMMNSFRFVWKKVMSERVLFADLKLQDIPFQNNYYFMHIYRNNVGYRWAVMRDNQNPNDELQQLFGCTTKRQMDDNDGDALRDGDRIRLEVRTIDRASYDYLFSLQQMDNSGTNPIQNFTGGCLGYFSAYSYITYETTFRLADVTEE